MIKKARRREKNEPEKIACNWKKICYFPLKAKACERKRQPSLRHQLSMQTKTRTCDRRKQEKDNEASERHLGIAKEKERRAFRKKMMRRCERQGFFSGALSKYVLIIIIFFCRVFFPEKEQDRGTEVFFLFSRFTIRNKSEARGKKKKKIQITFFFFSKQRRPSTVAAAVIAAAAAANAAALGRRERRRRERCVPLLRLLRLPRRWGRHRLVEQREDVGVLVRRRLFDRRGGRKRKTRSCWGSRRRRRRLGLMPGRLLLLLLLRCCRRRRRSSKGLRRQESVPVVGVDDDRCCCCFRC